MGMNRKYWKGIDELHETPQFLDSRDQEFPAQTSVEEFLGDDNLQESSTGRRDFLKFLGFSVAAATVAACEAPVNKAVPYVNKPENVTPGMPTWYASTYYDGISYASILVKTREGRPIFIKGNKDFGITQGGVNPRIVASVLSLYDSERLTRPTIDQKAASYSDLDKKVAAGLKAAGKVTLVSNTITGPTALTAINALREKVGADKFQHIQYDATSYAGMREANKRSFNLTVDSMKVEASVEPVDGETMPEDMPMMDASGDGPGIIPSYDFSKAKTIVSVGADFLNSWLMPTVFSAQYGQRRKPDGEWMSKHFQFESMMSVTGSNADVRGMIKPSEQANVLAYLLSKFGVSTSVSTKLEGSAQKAADKAYNSLKVSKDASLVVCGSNDVDTQMLCNKLNAVLGAYKTTINVNDPIRMFMSDDAAMMSFASDVAKKNYSGAVIFYGVNPVYTLPNGEAFGKGLENIKTSVSMSLYADETASRCKYIASDLHQLEAWNDYNVVGDHYAIGQPTIRPLHNTSSAIESFLVWGGEAKRGDKDSKVVHDLMQQLWVDNGMQMSGYDDPHTYWNMMVHNSCAPNITNNPTEPTFVGNLSSLKAPSIKGEWEVVMYQKSGMGIGQQANNPWLQEMADSLTKATWDNYITMNPKDMDKVKAEKYFDQESGLSVGKLTVNGQSIELPIMPLPGQALGTVGVALGYGRGANGEKIGKAAYQTKEYGGYVTKENGDPMPIGANAFALAAANSTYSLYNGGSLKVTAEKYLVAVTQIHGTAMGRNSIIRETTLEAYKNKDKSAYNPEYTLQKVDKDGHHVDAPIEEFDLWDAHPVENVGHRWGMTVDLSSCIGCGSCLIACQSENNVPVVGKTEVRKGREMAWLRIDRYFASTEEAAPGTRKDHEKSKIEWFADAEDPELNPMVVHQPMMCHHCNHAPCETVCPVAATTHSNEGLNQMTYNRCIGTRYCANNCPYKVRRFNWFNYPSYKAQAEINPAQDDLGRMVLNPDVTVRTRGVMEKCSMCVQRIQAGKLDAKVEGRPVQDGDYSTACADVCPTNAITVGDWNDAHSAVRKSADDKRAYQALEEVGVKPNVWFKVKVRNEDNKVLDALQQEHKEEEQGHGEHGDDHGKKKHATH
ncbi:MAG: TAT-variant-translocated molybdopterin oxidoreductase [Crocinitomicaceae bacterium]